MARKLDADLRLADAADKGFALWHLGNLLKQREVDFTLLLELHAHAVSDVHAVHVAPNDVGREKYIWRAIDRDASNDVWDIQLWMPFLVVDCEGINDSGATYGLRSNVLGKAFAADRLRRVDEAQTVFTTEDLQFAYSPSCPKRPIDGV